MHGATIGGQEDRVRVGAYTEWDTLREVVVGRVDGACWPDWHRVDSLTVSEQTRNQVLALREHWRAYPHKIKEDADRCYREFIAILEGEGVRVRRPDVYPFDAPYETPKWRVRNGFCSANPRDVILVVGDTFLECPMAHRGRYNETCAYRSLMRDYWRRGARWAAAPRPELLDELYDAGYSYPEGHPEDVTDDWDSVDPDAIKYLTTEFEPVFDAADFVRCGRDIFGQRSHVTNMAGIAWLRRFLEPEYRLHLIPSRCPGAYHIDTTFMPLAPGKALINPNWVDPARLPSALRRWDILVAPAPRSTPVETLGWMSDWISMNVFMLDEQRVVVERKQEDLMNALRRWGFKVIPCRFEDHYPFLGSLHCATLDTVRDGALQDYS